MSIFKGSGTAIVTPFKQDGVDYDAFSKMIQFQLTNSTDALIVCGTTGEASTMSDEEKLEVVRFAKSIVKEKIPVIVGTGGNDTAHSILLSKEVEKIGVDGLLLVTPYYNKTTQAGLIEHYKAIAKSVNLPLILYNVPSRTGMNISPKTVAELNKVENIVAVKEASGDISQIAEIASICDIDIYSGNDDQIVPVLSVGGIGVISVLSNIFPKETHDIVALYQAGKVEESRDLQLKFLNLIKLLFIETNPIPVKAALSMMGYCEEILRLPLIPMSDTNKKALKEEMSKFIKM